MLLLNNDILALEKGWFVEMVSQALRCGIGCVGAKLLYSDQTIQHAGVIGLECGAGHAFRGVDCRSRINSNVLHVVRNYSALTAACLMLKKELFILMDLTIYFTVMLLSRKIYKQI